MNDGILDGILIDTQASRAEEADRAAATGRLAVTTIRKLTLLHDRRCRGECQHRNHRRDHDSLAESLDLFDLDGEPAQLPDYESRLDWASVSESDAVYMSGRSYGG